MDPILEEDETPSGSGAIITEHSRRSIAAAAILELQTQEINLTGNRPDIVDEVEQIHRELRASAIKIDKLRRELASINLQKQAQLQKLRQYTEIIKSKTEETELYRRRAREVEAELTRVVCSFPNMNSLSEMKRELDRATSKCNKMKVQQVKAEKVFHELKTRQENLELQLNALLASNYSMAMNEPTDYDFERALTAIENSRDSLMKEAGNSSWTPDIQDLFRSVNSDIDTIKAATRTNHKG